jgi:drug/metabolite transporter (DMT)-like permease
MSWQILLIISIVFLSLNGLFHKSLLRDDKSDPRAQAIIFLGIGGVLSILIAILRGKLQLEFPSSLIFNFLAIAVFATIAYVLKYRGFQLITASEVVIFSTTSKFWNVVGASIFLHETITIQKIFGTIIIFGGIAVTMYIDKKFKINKGIFFVLLGAVLFGLTDINGYYILQTMDASNYQIYFYLLPVFALLLVQPSSIRKLSYYFKLDRAIKVTALAVFDTLGMLALFFAYQVGGKASVIGPLSATKVVVTVVLAIIFLKERDNITKKMIGAIITVVGVVLLL